ncbi:MurR/RpiR family transcriptional regulator [Streptomyces sp. HB2AG]|uniref:MurR/RpiR family transcriptional regulator n=1 Tax=Streptomyces sp. HB2AG TaxID=2983400 RepID=UPI0022AA4D4F|nr:MurR/RpiR family transcriptional regulator [Streptomyces sp. HB2AG]MCZ2526741.1 MurR/RpiR family transcriptional regulator [Streptomyces sp. HB2AG]
MANNDAPAGAGAAAPVPGRAGAPAPEGGPGAAVGPGTAVGTAFAPGTGPGAGPEAGPGAGPGPAPGSEPAAARLLRLFEGHRLTPTQRRIAHCLVRRAADAPFLSSVELAELAGVSQPSVTRFAVALGFDGYPALRRHLREVAPAGRGPAAPRVNEYQQAVQAEIENLRHLAALLADPAPVARAGRLLAASRPLPVLGLRAAGPQARGFAYFAAKVHPDVRLLDEGGTMLADRIDAAVRAGASALLCFALPRHPREVVEALEYAQAAGLTVITVADSAFAPVAGHSDLLLPAAVGTGLVFDTACAPMMLGRVLLESMCDGIPDAQARLEEFDVRAAARGLFAD